jgi:hypothetical protein
MNTLSTAIYLIFTIATFGWQKASIVVESYDNGAGSCVGGKTAVGGDHTKSGKTIKATTLKAMGITVKVGGVAIAEGGKGIASFGKTVPILVSGKNMKGVLVRVQAPSGVSTTNVLTPGTGLKLCSKCASPVVGVTHTSSKTVSSYSSNIKFGKSTTGVILDITVVFSLSDKSATHSYGRVTVDFTKARRL